MARRTLTGSAQPLAGSLAGLPEIPWATWARGKPISPNRVAQILGEYKIQPATVTLANGSQPNGYKLSDFHDAFSRYFPNDVEEGTSSSPSASPSTDQRSPEDVSCRTGEAQTLKAQQTPKSRGKPSEGELGNIEREGPRPEKRNHWIDDSDFDIEAIIREALEKDDDFIDVPD